MNHLLLMFLVIHFSSTFYERGIDEKEKNSGRSVEKNKGSLHCFPGMLSTFRGLLFHVSGQVEELLSFLISCNCIFVKSGHYFG